MEIKTQQEIEQEMLELNEQFSAFLHTKGIKAFLKSKGLDGKYTVSVTED